MTAAATVVATRFARVLGDVATLVVVLAGLLIAIVVLVGIAWVCWIFLVEWVQL